ncbi:Smr family protein [Granulibacter bethesdensis]|nr:Smr family protein [Granulibacter bethesdensis]
MTSISSCLASIPHPRRMAKRPYNVPPVTPGKALTRPGPPSRRSARKLSEAERTEWTRYTVAVIPLHGKAGHGENMTPPAAAITDSPIHSARHSPVAAPSFRQTEAGAGAPTFAQLFPLPAGAQPPGVDTGTWNRFRNGRLGATRTLDLHGHTLQRAYHTFEAMLLRAHADGLRCIEVITGRGRTGSGETVGAIRRELPLWINLPHLRPLVLGITYPHAANTGSVRILLRKQK